MVADVGDQTNGNKMSTYTNTTASAILVMASADRVTLDLSSLEVGGMLSATGVRQLVGGGSRKTGYAVERVADDFGSRRYNCVQTVIA